MMTKFRYLILTLTLTLIFTFVSISTLTVAQEPSSNSRKLELLYFYTNSCKYCQKMDRTTWQDKTLKRAIKKRIRLNRVNAYERPNEVLKWKVTGTPTTIFIVTDKDRRYADTIDRWDHYVKAETILKAINDEIRSEWASSLQGFQNLRHLYSVINTDTDTILNTELPTLPTSPIIKKEKDKPRILVRKIRKDTVGPIQLCTLQKR